MARGCFLARQDQLLGTLALTLTSWAAFDPNLNDGVRRHFEPGPDSAQCGFGRASHSEFGAFFPGAGGLHSVYGSGGTEKKRTVDRKVWDFLGLVPSATELRARRLQRYQDLVKDPTAHQNVLLSFFGEGPFAVGYHF